MIPRTKANYTLVELLKAAMIREHRSGFRRELTQLLRSYTGEKNILLTPSGRCGLYCILRAIDQVRVLVPAYTCKAVIEAILMAGKTPIYVEVEANGFNMDPIAVERELDNSSVIIATHQFGIPCQIEPILKLAGERGAFVIEDAAASLGTRVAGKLTGTFGDAAFFSFDSTKLVNVPMKGGFITVRDPSLFRRIAADYAQVTGPMSLLRKSLLLAQALILILLEIPLLYRVFHWLMFESRGQFTQDSSKLALQLDAFYRYDFAEWQAYIALRQVRQLESLIEKRRLLYREYLSSLDGLHSIQLPPRDSEAEWACVRFPIRVRGDKLAYYRRATRRGIDFAFSFTYLACPRSFERDWSIADSVLDLPFYPKLEREDLAHVIRELRDLERGSSNEDR